MENKKSIELWLKTSKVVTKTINNCIKNRDTDTIITLLNKYKKATDQLERLLKMDKEERFTA